MVHTDCLNYIIKKKGFKSYLEIGVNDPTKNFDLIECQFKIGVDPEPRAKANFCGTSDEFFETILTSPIKSKIGFDLIFIDGLHHYENVGDDLYHSFTCLNEGGVIVIHDTDPKEESYTCVPRNGLRGRWNGDVYRIITDLNQYGLIWKTLDYEANGVTVCKVVAPHAYYEKIEPFKDYQDFLKRRDLLHLCTKKEFEEWV